MKIYLESFKYEYELKTLIQSSEALKKTFVFLDLYSFSGQDDEAYMLFKRDEIDFTVIRCEYKLDFMNVILYDKIRQNEATEKNCYKRLFYQFLSKNYDFNLDWGILTGIRPTKLFHEYSLKYSDNAQRDIDFKNDFLVSDTKLRMLSQINEIQNVILRDIDKNNYSIYISVPFCPSKCSYCTFFSNDIHSKEKLTIPYIESLNKELSSVLDSKWVKNKKLDSIYFGGGTPSSLNLADLSLLLKTINDRVDFKAINEVTFEAGRPDTIDIEKLKLLKSFGINRISINPQTMVDDTLKAIGRNHSSAEIIKCFEDARAVGFDNINMDIILGLENETLEDVKYTLSRIFDLSPDSVTMHSLTLKKASDLTKKIDMATLKKQNQKVMKMTELVYSEMEKNGYAPYYLYRQKNTLGGQENIGFSKKGKESLYNIFIIEEYQNILSFGPGAISRYIFPYENRIERVSNTKNLEEYMENIDKYIKKKLEMQL